jgi:hypothetical protein
MVASGDSKISKQGTASKHITLTVLQKFETIRAIESVEK